MGRVKYDAVQHAKDLVRDDGECSTTATCFDCFITRKLEIRGHLCDSKTALKYAKMYLERSPENTIKSIW